MYHYVMAMVNMSFVNVMCVYGCREFQDRAQNTITDGYDDNEHSKISLYLLRKGDGHGIKYRADHLIGDSMLQVQSLSARFQ